MASPELTEKFYRVKPSFFRNEALRPCRLTLRDGRRLDRVACIEEGHGIYNKAWVPLDQIIDVEESPYRLPAEMATELYKMDESGMGNSMFTVYLNDGRQIECATGSALVDFPVLPPDVTTTNIVAVTASMKGSCRKTPIVNVEYCYFVPTFRAD